MSPAEIAKRLSPAQKRALLWLDGDIHMARRKLGKMQASMWALLDRGLVERCNGWWSVSRTGLLVRAELEKERHHAEG